MRLAVFLAALAAALGLAVSTAPAKAPGSLDLVRKGLARAVEAGDLDAAEASGYQALAKRAVLELGKLPRGRADTLRGALGDVAGRWGSYTTPIALTLFSMLEVNMRELAARRLPASGSDIQGGDGVVYRFVTGHGYAFHPLANFARLNTLVLGGRDEDASRLAAALAARGVSYGRGIVWQYTFPFGRGKPPWISGMAQAVAAQALARTADAVQDPILMEAATGAYSAIPGRLVTAFPPTGPWIKLYSFDPAPVLNAQLQAVLSIGDYARLSGNSGAAGLAAQLRRSAETLLPRFDTGYWSLYSLRGTESRLDYHDYVITLLKKLAVRTGASLWRDTADRFESYETEPPVLKLPAADAAAVTQPLVIYPDPEDGYLDRVEYSVWLSKRSSVTLHAGGEATTFSFGHGWSTIAWAPGPRAPGIYRPYLTAVDPAGNGARLVLRQAELRTDSAPPEIDAAIGGRRTLVWKAVDEGTPYLELTIRLVSGTKRKALDLGRRELHGLVTLRLPPGSWQGTLIAENTAGKRASVDLGTLPR